MGYTEWAHRPSPLGKRETENVIKGLVTLIPEHPTNTGKGEWRRGWSGAAPRSDQHPRIAMMACLCTSCKHPHNGRDQSDSAQCELGPA